MRVIAAAAAALAAGAARAHDGASAWSADPWLWLLLVLPALLALRGFASLRRRTGPQGTALRRREVAAFVAGWLVLAAALLSPLDPLGERLFWVHMVQHEALMLVAAPLLVLSRPVAPMLWGLPASWRVPLARGAARVGLAAALGVLARPLVAWSVHAGALWLWHAPALFDAALNVPWVHDLQHASFFGSALLFWWALLAGGAARFGGAVLYVFTTAVHTSVLGALLTFSGRALYGYGERGVPFGLTALEDQQLGGLVMWVPGGVVYLVVALLLFQAWLAASERAAAPGRAA